VCKHGRGAASPPDAPARRRGIPQRQR
jgi:hypothetical protein